MKKLIALSIIAFLGGLLIGSSPIRAQEVKKEKKVRIKTVKVENGKETVTDTTFVITDDMDEAELEAMGIKTKGGDVDITVDVKVDEDGSTTKVFMFKNSDASQNAENAYYFKTDGGKGKAVIMWVDEDGKKMELDLNQDMDNLEKEFEVQMELLEDELGDLAEKKIIIMKDLDGLEGMSNFEVIVPDLPVHPGSFYFEYYDQRVTDIELRDAGIKNKPNRLETTETIINVDNGIVDLSFKLKNEGNPKVTVYNVYGDKVYSGKPEMTSGSYKLKMDLSQKQYGTYYLMVTDGNASFTEKLKL